MFLCDQSNEMGMGKERDLRIFKTVLYMASDVAYKEPLSIVNLIVQELSGL